MENEMSDEGSTFVYIVGEGAWDHVRGGDLPWELVKAANMEGVKFMISKGLWEFRPVKECWDRKGKPPTSIRWVDTDKGNGETWETRSRLVALDFKGGDKDRGFLFADTPPLEAVRMLFSKAATRRRGRRRRKLLFIDVKKAHLNPKCEEDVYIELPEECGAPLGMCGKLNFWLYGFRKAASAWEAFIQKSWRK